MPKTKGRPIKWTECPQKLCTVNISALERKARYKHVAACIQKQEKESQLLADIKQHKMKEVLSEDYTADAALAATRFDYERLISLVEVRDPAGDGDIDGNGAVQMASRTK